MSGEVSTRASTNGRQLTLDPIMERELLTVQPVRVESSLAAGLRIEWADGELGETKYDLSCGAGVGSPYLLLHIETADGTKIDELIDIRPMMQNWILTALAASGLESPYQPTEAQLLQPAEPIPFDPGPGWPQMLGYVVGHCGHRVTMSEWKAGFLVCERCQHEECWCLSPAKSP